MSNSRIDFSIFVYIILFPVEHGILAGGYQLAILSFVSKSVGISYSVNKHSVNVQVLPTFNLAATRAFVSCTNWRSTPILRWPCVNHNPLNIPWERRDPHWVGGVFHRSSIDILG